MKVYLQHVFFILLIVLIDRIRKWAIKKGEVFFYYSMIILLIDDTISHK